VPAHYRQRTVKVRRHPLDAGLGPRVRVRPWAFDRDVVQLALADQGIVPSVDEIRRWVDTLTADRGVDDPRPLRTIRTGALFADAAARFGSAGFAVIDTLALLRIDLAGSPRRRPAGATSSPLRPRRHAEAARVDRDAFGDPWGNDATDLGEIRRATPTHRARARFVSGPGGRRLVAFAITGAAAGHGYLQRLAVDPPHQGQGHGRALVLDSLAWMRGRRLGHGLVNTAVNNERALALYESVGFRRLDEQLVVMQLDVLPPAR
jgi:ribosomal protein S18 acetylase RimI-like enzyme